MQFFLLFLALVSAAYFLLMLLLIYGWKAVKSFKSKGLAPETKFSIIVPFRNEAENLPRLLISLSNLEYPSTHFEIILVNDESEDKSLQACFHFKRTHPELQFSVINNKRKTNSPKKDAIVTAIELSRFDYILTTDADCEVPVSWLQLFNECVLQTDAKLIAAPVSFFKVNTFKEQFLNYLIVFQELDFMSLQAAGIGGFGLKQPFMCNAANMCYEKKAFYEATGFDGNFDISSGDDVFLLQKFHELKLKTEFLKSEKSVVFTKAQGSILQLYAQRIRWAAKTSAYTALFPKIIGLCVLLMNLLIIITIVLSLLQFIPYQGLLFSFLLKFIADLGLLYFSATFFRKKYTLSHYLWSSIVYPFFSTSVALLSMFSGFTWKGRSFKK